MIEVQSDYQNLQGFMKQLRINSRQARQLIFLTLYDFIIRHRPGLLNPTDGPSRQPNYIVSAQKELSLIQKGLLAKKLVGPDLLLPEAVRLCDAAEPRLIRPGQSDSQQVAEELCDIAEASSGLPKVGLYSDIDIGQPIQGLSCLEQQEAEARLPRIARV